MKIYLSWSVDSMDFVFHRLFHVLHFQWIVSFVDACLPFTRVFHALLLFIDFPSTVSSGHLFSHDRSLPPIPPNTKAFIFPSFSSLVLALTKQYSCIKLSGLTLGLNGNFSAGLLIGPPHRHVKVLHRPRRGIDRGQLIANVVALTCNAM